MNKYLESIQSIDNIGTSLKEQAPPSNTVILEVSGDLPASTFADMPIYPAEIKQGEAPYSAPQKVIVRTYRLRK